MTNLQMWNLIIGFFAPAVCSMINQPSFDSRARTAVMASFSVIAAFGIAYFGGEFNAVDIVTGILITMVTAIAVFQGVFKPTGLDKAIEEKTSIKKNDTSDLAKPSKTIGKHSAAYFQNLRK